MLDICDDYKQFTEHIMKVLKIIEKFMRKKKGNIKLNLKR